jgi:hypothetical protein
VPGGEDEGSFGQWPRGPDSSIEETIQACLDANPLRRNVRA